MSSHYLHLIEPSSVAVELATDAELKFTIKSVSPLTIPNNGLVTVLFNSTTPGVDDWIGAYSPPNADVTTTSPVKFGYCGRSSDSQYMTTGNGQLEFNITNLRDGVQFYLFSGGTRRPTLQTSSSEIVNFRDNNEPLKHRIVPTGDHNVYSLLWSSANSTIPQLRWGILNATYTFALNASTSTLSKDSMCGGAATTIGWRSLGYIHTANFSGIVDMNLSNKVIYYIFGDAATDNFSPQWTFFLPPLPGTQPPTRPTTVALLADLGVGTNDDSYDTTVWNEACPPAVNTTNSIGDSVLRGEIDLVFLSGDVSYANGYLSNWDFFLDNFSPIAGRVPLLTTVGNHESDWPGTASNAGYGTASGGECSVAALTLLPMPYPAQTDAPWWSYDVGLLHIVGMSTEHDFTKHSQQYYWIESDLKAVNRSVTPWIVFSGHRPMYVDSDSCCTNNKNCEACTAGWDVEVMQSLQANVEPLLKEYQVNLAFSGHFHNYQRQAAVFQGEVVQLSTLTQDAEGNDVHLHENPKGTVWMLIGSAGNGPSLSSHNYSWSEAYWDRTWGWAKLTATNATHLQWEFINSANDQVIDRMVITQDFGSWSEGSSSSAGLSATEVGAIAACAVVVGLGLLGLMAYLLSFMRAEDSGSLNAAPSSSSSHPLWDSVGNTSPIAESSSSHGMEQGMEQGISMQTFPPPLQPLP